MGDYLTSDNTSTVKGLVLYIHIYMYTYMYVCEYMYTHEIYIYVALKFAKNTTYYIYCEGGGGSEVGGGTCSGKELKMMKSVTI